MESSITLKVINLIIKYHLSNQLKGFGQRDRERGWSNMNYVYKSEVMIDQGLLDRPLDVDNMMCLLECTDRHEFSFLDIFGCTKTDRFGIEELQLCLEDGIEIFDYVENRAKFILPSDYVILIIIGF
jgi:hypothetical protein